MYGKNNLLPVAPENDIDVAFANIPFREKVACVHQAH